MTKAKNIVSPDTWLQHWRVRPKGPRVCPCLRHPIEPREPPIPGYRMLSRCFGLTCQPFSPTGGSVTVSKGQRNGQAAYPKYFVVFSVRKFPSFVSTSAAIPGFAGQVVEIQQQIKKNLFFIPGKRREQESAAKLSAGKNGWQISGAIKNLEMS